MMQTRVILSGIAACVCAATIGSAQIAPQGGIQGRPPQPKTQQPRAQPTESPAIAFGGCLYHEDAIPGRSPNIAEKAGVGADYILADATPTSKPAAPTAGLATGRMYKVTKIDGKQLSDLAGKRVEVTGTIKPDDDARSGEPGESFKNLPNIEGTSIHEVAGAECPARPEISSPATPPPTPNR
jgi:hypothetical protein